MIAALQEFDRHPLGSLDEGDADTGADGLGSTREFGALGLQLTADLVDLGDRETEVIETAMGMRRACADARFLATRQPRRWSQPPPDWPASRRPPRQPQHCCR